jgi:hypothetical protein
MQKNWPDRQRQVGAFCDAVHRAISQAMNAPTHHAIRRAGLIAAGALALSAASGLAFAAWLESGPSMFMAMVQSGFSLCF